MTYELAKKLKEAGLPEGYIGDVESTIGKPGEPRIYCPTLEELIEACGNGNFTLIKMRINGKCSADMKDENGKILGVALNYETPEEAVANLYLALNQKNP